MERRPSLTTLFGGVPFLDLSFDTHKMMSAVACSRAWRVLGGEVEQLAIKNLPVLLVPSVARRLRLNEGVDVSLQSQSLTVDQERQIERALAYVVRIVPHWKPLLNLPLTLRSIYKSKAISCSSYAYPQHIFLSPGAFTSDIELREQLLHEISHNWLYLIEELWPLHRPEYVERFQLPSGTPNRNASEVLGAAYVAAVLLDWYAAQASLSISVERSAYLRRYLVGCLSLLNTIRYSHLTPGRARASGTVRRLCHCIG